MRVTLTGLWKVNKLRYCTRALIFVLTVIPLYGLAVLVRLVTYRGGLCIAVAVNRFFLRLFGVRVVLENENPQTEALSGCVFVLLDQTSLLDGTILSVVVPQPFRGITNIEYALLPVVGWGAVAFAWVIVRQWPVRARKTLSRVGQFLKGGGNVFVSIEGRISSNGTLAPYKKGPVVIAIESKARIVPMYIRGVRGCLPPRSLKIRPGEVTVKFLRAISTEGMSYEDRDQVVARLRSVAEREMLRADTSPCAMVDEETDRVARDARQEPNHRINRALEKR